MKEKTVYRVDHQGVFCAPVTLDDSDRSPLEPTVWLIPAGCVDVKPPTLNQDERAIFNGRDWDVVAAEASNSPAATGAGSEKPAAEDVVAYLKMVTQEHLDAGAQGKGYDGILSLCSYAQSTSPQFAAEAQAGIEWRDAVWVLCHKLLAEAAGTGNGSPTASDWLAQLPKMSWPEEPLPAESET